MKSARLLPVLGLLLACSESSVVVSPVVSIQDAVHNSGNTRFYWLPPLVRVPSPTGVFDGTLAPVVRITELGTGTPIAEYTTETGPGSETVRVVLNEEHYIVNWHTDQFDLDPLLTYRIDVLVDGSGLGHADVDVVSSGSELKHVQTGEFIALKDGRTLPIQFRIEEGEEELPFDAPARWAAYNAGSTPPFAATRGYRHAAFDGRYVYFVPSQDGSTYHGTVLRYDTQGLFLAADSWAAYEAGGTAGLTNTKGYDGAVFDGRFVYFVPSFDGNAHHAKVLRFDTQGAFTATASWAAYNAEVTDGFDTRGYAGGAFDGRYVYFAPNSDGVEAHGRVLRYDTQGSFGVATSWAAHDAGNSGGLSNTRGYDGAIFDGRYVYFVPKHDGVGAHGKVLRYDTEGAFTALTSWAAFDASNMGGLSTTGYVGATFDGQYVYFVPYGDAVVRHGNVLRYDTQTSFTALASWAAYNAGSAGGFNTKGYSGAVFDGRYVYFVPNHDGVEAHGRVLRYDTQGLFGAVSSWAAHDAGSTGGLSDTKGYVGAVFQAPYVYFVPLGDAIAGHGKVLRYDATP